MIARHLVPSFASQSALRILSRVADGRGAVLLVGADNYPRAGSVRVAGLVPGRHYLLCGATHRFCRADSDGAALVEVRLDAPALLAFAPVL